MNKVVVITGASHGVGFATAELFAEQGYRVINLSRHRLTLENITHLTIDLTDVSWPLTHIETLQTLLQDAQSITLVHNAALMAKDSMDDVKNYNLQQVLQINAIASTQLNQLLLPLMKPGSSILYISSTLNEKTVTNNGSYVVSKHAQVSLMKATCQDLMVQGIHTACICPCFTGTHMLKHLENNNHEIFQHSPIQTSFKRILAPREFASTVKYCAETPSINGSVIHAKIRAA